MSDIFGYFILFCVYIWLFKCVYIVLCIYLAFQISYIYVRRIDSSLFFYAGFFGAPWKIRDGTMAALETMYFVVVRELTLELYKDLCDFHRYKESPNMSLTNEYSSYVNITSTKEFLIAVLVFYF